MASCCGSNETMARMEPMSGAYTFIGADMGTKVLMEYTGHYDSEWINCDSGGHYLSGKGQQFKADEWDVADLVKQGVAKQVKAEALPVVEPKSK